MVTVCLARTIGICAVFPVIVSKRISGSFPLLRTRVTLRHEATEEISMTKIRFQIAPDVEFKMDLEIEGISEASRDYDVQQHKLEVYQEFERRLQKAFPEGIHIDRFDFGLSQKTTE